MTLSNAAETGLMKLIFQAVDWALIADDAASTPETNIGVALHTGDPGEAGTQLTNEAGYTSYARQDIARTAGGWAESAGVITPVANIDFPESTGGGGETETHFSCGFASSDVMIVSGTVTPNIVETTGVTPRLSTSTTITAE